MSSNLYQFSYPQQAAQEAVEPLAQQVTQALSAAAAASDAVSQIDSAVQTAISAANGAQAQAAAVASDVQGATDAAASATAAVAQIQGAVQTATDAVNAVQATVNDLDSTVMQIEATVDAIAPPITDPVEARLADLDRKAHEIRKTGVAYGGRVFALTDSWLTEATFHRANSTVPRGFFMMDRDGARYALSFSRLRTMLRTIDDYMLAVRSRQADLIAEIRAAADPAAVDIDTGWPAPP